MPLTSALYVPGMGVGGGHAYSEANSCLSCPLPLLGKGPDIWPWARGSALSVPVFFCQKLWEGVAFPEPALVTLGRTGGRDKAFCHPPHPTHTQFPHEVLDPLAVLATHWQMEMELSSMLEKLALRRAWKGSSAPARVLPTRPLPPSPQLLCRNSSLGSPSNLCGSPPASIRKPPNLEGIVFPGESGLTPGSYKKAPGFEREDQVGAEFLKNFKCQVRSARGSPGRLSCYTEGWPGLAWLWAACLGATKPLSSASLRVSSE